MANKPKSRTAEYRAIQRLLAQYTVAYEAGEYGKARQIAITAKQKYDVDLNKTSLVRNTRPYNFLFDNSSYDFLVNPNDINEQKTFVTDTSAGSINEIGVTTGGTGYRTCDLVYFNNTGTSGNQAKGRVRLVEGKSINQISIANTTFSNVEFVPETNTKRYVGYTTIPHNLYTREFAIISGLSTNGIANNVTQRVGIITERFKLFGEVAGISTTGIVTFFNIDGQVDTIKENDVLGIGTEKVKVLNVDNDLTRIRVIREYDSTVGSSHTSNSLISQNPRSLYFTPIGKNKSSNFRFNKELYFNPKESVALGNVSGVGIGSTLFFSNPGTGIS